MVSVFRVKERSMSPYCQEGDFVLSSRLSYRLSQPKTGDVVLMRSPWSHRMLLKRITQVKDDLFWVEGDNKKESVDSRTFGWIPKHAIAGKAWVIRKPEKGLRRV